ncbi:MAG: glycosyltransferase, partial [Thermoplasmata archaeon]
MIETNITNNSKSGVYGYVSSVDERGISGWILDLDEEINAVEIYINNVKVAEKWANMPSPDIDSIVGKKVDCGFLILWKEIRVPMEALSSGKFDLFVLHKRTKDVLAGKYSYSNNLMNYTSQESKQNQSPKTQNKSIPTNIPNALIEEYNIIKESGLFDEDYYLENNPDVKEAGIDPLYHFIVAGWKEGRNPSRKFNTNLYKSVNQDVKDINPLLHYILHGAKECRALKPFSKDEHIYNVSNLVGISSGKLTNEYIYEFVSKKLTEPIDILIPVYNGYEYLKPLFKSITRNTNIPYRLIICDDCSSDERVYNFLNQIKTENHQMEIVLLRNTENLGFVKTVNKLAMHSRNHFVILNTDTEVPPGWLERLIFPLLYFDRVASVTPFSNSATICSFPTFLKDNDLYLGLDVETIDKYFKNINIEKTMQILPTGVGFCMAINKEVYETIGLFDEIFGRGYGEENDWCMRASKIGYKNLIATNLFVYHKHGGSFNRSKEISDLMEKNLRIVVNRHPSYINLVDYFISLDPLKLIRDVIRIKILTDNYQATFIVDHNLGGGANEYTRAIIKDLEIYMLFHNDLTLEIGGVLLDKKIKIHLDNLDELDIIFDTFKFEKLIINNFYHFQKVPEFIDKLLEIAKKKKLKIIYNLHDYYSICPSVHLINQNNEYCGIPDSEDICNSCIKENRIYVNKHDKKYDIRTFRSAFKKLLDSVDIIKIFSKSSMEVLSKVYDIQKHKLEYSPHKVDYVRPVKKVRDNKQRENINIGIL